MDLLASGMSHYDTGHMVFNLYALWIFASPCPG